MGHKAAMETLPPSYQTATTWDAWAIVAPYIPSVDLCAASLVSQRWHEIFVPFLWGNPASHFGIDNDAVYGGHTYADALIHTLFYVNRLTFNSLVI